VGEICPAESATTDSVVLAIEVEGMTCASCVRRVEKGLLKVPGVVEAGVNLATERATVVYDPTRAGVAELVAKVEATGYAARPIAAATAAPAEAIAPEATAEVGIPADRVLAEVLPGEKAAAVQRLQDQSAAERHAAGASGGRLLLDRWHLRLKSALGRERRAAVAFVGDHRGLIQARGAREVSFSRPSFRVASACMLGRRPRRHRAGQRHVLAAPLSLTLAQGEPYEAGH
jgi:copper chaperone CopZ